MNTRVRKLLLFSLAFSGLFYLATILLYSWHNRVSADDYQAMAKLRTLGFWATQLNWYQTWIGRWSSGFFQTLFTGLVLDSGKPFIFDLITFAVFTGSVIALFCSLLRVVLGQSESGLNRAENLVIGAFLANLMYFSVPLSRESFLWLSGSVSYSWGVSLLFFWLSATERAISDSQPVWIWLSAVLAAFVAGTNESIGLMVLCLISGAAFMAAVLRRGSWLRVLTWPAIASSISFAIVALSPGNAVRRSGIHYHAPISIGLRKTVTLLLPFLRDMCGYGRYWFPFAALISFFVVQLVKRQRASVSDDHGVAFWVRYALVAGIGCLALNLLLIFPSIYVSGEIPPPRSWVSNIAVTFVFVVGFSSFVSSRVSVGRKVANAAAILISALAIGIGFYRGSLLRRQFDEMAAYSAAFDRRLTLIQEEKRSGRKEALAVESLPFTDAFAYCEWDVPYFRAAFELPFDVFLNQSPR